METFDAEKELINILQKEIDKIWEETPIGYNEDNDGYHMGKGLIVNKKTWDKYVEALKHNPKLNAYEFMIEIVKKSYEEMENDDSSKSE